MKKLALLCALAFLATGCPGPEGEQGIPGPQGLRGPPGEAGPRLTSTLSCSAILRVDPTRGIVAGAKHYAYLYSDGSVTTQCEFASSTNTVGAVGFNIYMPNQQGASDASCTVFNDMDTNTSGYWTFSIQNPRDTSPRTSKVTYADIGSQYDKLNYLVACTRYP